MATGVLCDADCNIRVDLVVLFPVLLIATLYARRSYKQPSKQLTVVGMFLGSAGLALLALVLVAFGFVVWASLAGICSLAIGLYAIKRFADNRYARNGPG